LPSFANPIVVEISRPSCRISIAAVRELQLVIDRVSVTFVQESFVVVSTYSCLTKLEVKSAAAARSSPDAGMSVSGGIVRVSTGSFMFWYCTAHNVRFKSLKDPQLPDLGFSARAAMFDTAWMWARSSMNDRLFHHS